MIPLVGRAMSKFPDEDPHWEEPRDGDHVARDLRRQIEAVKSRMHNMRDGIAAALNAANGDDSPENAA